MVHSINSIHRKVIIIGSGPAGITAGLYAARAKMNPLIFEGTNPGGQLMGTAQIENWPGEESIFGASLIMKMREHAIKFEAEFLMEEIVSVDLANRPFMLTSSTGQKYSADALIIATGAGHKKIGCPGESEYWGKGVTTCAVCDGAFYKDMPVVVVGGGNTGAENALFLTKFTSDITLVHRSSALSATAVMQERIFKSGIKVIYDSTVSAIEGDDTHVTKVCIKNLKTNEEKWQKTSGVFISIGTQPKSDLFKGQLEIDKYGYIVIIKNSVETSVSGVFAAGDVANSLHRQAIVSSGMGCAAAIEAERFCAHN